MAAFQHPGRSAVYAANGLCATSHPLAAQAAVSTLQSGGNAVDAAIAGAVLLGICEPHMTGLGGDMFALVKPAGTEQIVGLNASGRAPAGLDAAALRAAGHRAMPEREGVSVVVPGAVAGFETLAGDYGLKGLDACLAPAIRYAEEGVPVAPRVAFDWGRFAGRLHSAGEKHYLADGLAPPPGALFSAPGQAEALRRIAADGARAFYEGEVAEDMVAALRAHGGAHTLEDFAAARADYVAPIAAGYREHEVVELPPNGQGAAALLLLRMLERLAPEGLDPLGAERAHLEMEIAKIGYAARNEAIADPAHMTMAPEAFFSDAVVERLAARVDPARAQPMPEAPLGGQHRDTVYITVVDRDRMAVSLIYSIFHSFGSGIASERFGVLFNSRAAGFTLEPGHPNEAGGGKRPMHTIIPGMIRLGGMVEMPFGVMGGPYQAAGHMRFVSNLVDHGMDVQQAIDAPRLFFEDGALDVEAGYSEEAVRALAAKGHEVRRPDCGIGGAQAIRIDHHSGLLIGGSDPRKDGIALGY
jgi:gamma-glutamyltranspeptidase/glutathione hydrolase